MERTLSQEERIRRAEEIYNRRRLEYEKSYSKKYVNYSMPSKRTIKERIVHKMVFQIFICFAIYIGLYTITNSNYIFSEDVRDKINYFLSYDMNFNNMYNMMCEYWDYGKRLINNSQEKPNEKNENENQAEDINNVESSAEETSEIESNEEIAVGGAEISEPEVETRTPEEIEIDYIKNNYGIIWPLNGVITSKYGTRTPTEIVTANHYGIDIGGNIGADIIAAMDGTVCNVSEIGDYGKHLQIENGDVSTLYAHCSELCVSNGDKVKKGDKIAEVGQTGRATGPHLHFEIKRNGKTLDPELILN